MSAITALPAADVTGLAADLAPELAVNAELTSRYGLFVNVTDPTYGAVGDGTTDDTTAIQAAITAATAGAGNKGTVFFPAGTYKTTAPLTVTVGSPSLRGAGRDQTSIKFVAATGYAIDQATSIASYSDFTIDGSAATGNAGAFRLLGNLTKNVVERVGFTSFATTGIAVDLDGASENTFDKCFWTGNSRNLRLRDNGAVTANANRFLACNLGSTVGTTDAAIELLNVEGNLFDAECIIQAVTNPITIHVHNTAAATGVDCRSNRFLSGYFEDNGNATAGSRNILIEGASGRPILGTVIRGNFFGSSVQDSPSRDIELIYTTDTFIDANYNNLAGGHVAVYDGGNNLNVHCGPNSFAGTVQHVGRPVVVANKTASQTLINAAGATKLTWTETIDTGGFFASSTFTPQMTGYYRACGVFAVENSSGDHPFRISLFKNGAEAAYMLWRTPNTGQEGTAFEFVVQLNGTTDYAEVFVANDGPTARNVDASAHLTISKVD